MLSYNNYFNTINYVIILIQNSYKAYKILYKNIKIFINILTDLVNYFPNQEGVRTFVSDNHTTL